MTLFADPAEGCAGPICETCEPLPHSGGGQARLTGALSPAGGLHLECTDGLAGEFCYLLTSRGITLPGMNAFSGRLCLMGQLGRYAPNTATNMGDGAFNSMGVFDAAGVYQNQAGTSTTGTGFDVPTTLPRPLLGTSSGETPLLPAVVPRPGYGRGSGLLQRGRSGLLGPPRLGFRTFPEVKTGPG